MADHWWLVPAVGGNDRRADRQRKSGVVMAQIDWRIKGNLFHVGISASGVHTDNMTASLKAIADMRESEHRLIGDIVLSISSRPSDSNHQSLNEIWERVSQVKGLSETQRYRRFATLLLDEYGV